MTGSDGGWKRDSRRSGPVKVENGNPFDSFRVKGRVKISVNRAGGYEIGDEPLIPLLH